VPKGPEEPEGRRFETAGKKIGGSRADLARMSMGDLEKNPTLARTLVTKTNVFGTWKPSWADADRENGVMGACSFAKREILEMVSGKPSDSAEMRDAYRKGGTALLDGLSRCKTVSDIQDFMAEWRDAAQGKHLGTERMKMGLDVKGTFNFDWKEAAKQSQYGYGAPHDYMRWLRSSVYGEPKHEGTLYDHYMAWVQLQNSPAAQNDLGELTGIAGWRLNSDGTASPLWQKGKEEVREYQLFTMALGKRFAELMGFKLTTGGYRGARLGTYHEGYLDRLKARKGLADSIARVQESGDYWAWAGVVKEKKEGAGAPKPEVKTVEKGDSKWVWTRTTGKVERKGGRPVATPEDSVAFMKSFGLPGVEYGHWANDAEREWHVTNAHGGLHDLADMLGIEPTKLGINGRLSVAFGARGTGGFRAPVAHYEPGRQVINLTKLKGAGSLAHEWGHFLDHAIMMAYTKVGKVQWASGGGARHELPPEVHSAVRSVMDTIKYEAETDEGLKGKDEKVKAIRNDMHALVSELDGQGAELKDLDKRQRKLYSAGKRMEADPEYDELTARRQELSESYNKLVTEYNSKRREVRALEKGPAETAHYAAAQELAGGTYYAQDVELFARAFESWVEDKLTAQGRKSGYLVQGTRGAEEAGGIYMPTGGAHRERTNAAIEALVGVLKKHDQFTKALTALSWGLWFREVVEGPELHVPQGLV